MAGFFEDDGEFDPLAPTGVKAAAGSTPSTPTTTAASLAKQASLTSPTGYVGTTKPSGGTYYDPAAQQKRFEAGNIGGAGGAYNLATDAGKANYDYMQSLGSPGALGTVTDLLNAGGAINNSYAGLANPLDPMGYLQSGAKPMLDPNTGLGVSGTGQSVGAMAPGAASLITDTHVGPVDALSAAMGGAGGLGGGATLGDPSGADRGGAGRIDANAMAQRGQEALARNPAGGAGVQQQQDVLDQVMAFANNQQQGPSQAALMLQQASQGNMADVLSAARSGRARDAGSQARAMNVAQGEIAGLGVDAARNAAMLRAQEDQNFRGQQLSALGLGGDVSGAIRGAGVQERGQSLGLESDILKTLPQLEGIRHEDEFELTPQQKLAAAAAGQRDPTAVDYVTGILGDVLPLIG